MAVTKGFLNLTDFSCYLCVKNINVIKTFVKKYEFLANLEIQ